MDRRTREGNYNPGNYRPYGRVDKKSLAGAGIRILVKRNRRVFGSHRSGGQKEIRVWTRKSSSRYRAAVEKSATWKGQRSGLNVYSVEGERGSQREAALSSKGYSASDERRILDAMGRGLLKEFPNPERIGCPSVDVLKRIAAHDMPLSEAEKCPCYRDFLQFQSAHRARRRQTLLGIAASILIIAGLAGWALLRKQSQPLVAQTTVLDLRNRSLARGGEPNSVEPPLEISRNVSRIQIYLPLGSSDGTYNLAIASETGHPLFTANGTAITKDGITSLTAEVNLSGAPSGSCFLRVRKVGSEWTSYPMSLK